MDPLSFVRPGPRRWRFLALATLGVLALHGLLLWALGPGWIDPEEPPAAATPLRVRSVTLPAPATLATAPPAPVEASVPVKAPSARPAARLAASAPQQTVARPAPQAPIGTQPAVIVESAPAPQQLPPAEPVVANERTTELPVYATRLPQAGAWRYQLQRGLAIGDAVLSWQPTNEGRYEMKLEGRVAGITMLDWVSRGTLDSAGIAPDRFVIRRRGRDSQAANFQRDAGKVTFSGPTHELPLLAGVQDRLSWLVQLPAVIDAAPERFGAGSRVVVMVVGARGGAEVWSFAVMGSERVGPTPALKLVREARRPRDTQVEIWLDPARGHLPLRALMTQVDAGAPLELTLDVEGKASTGP